MESMEKAGEQTAPTKPLRCIVKLGGAAVTCKNELEKINYENLRAISVHLRRAMVLGGAIGMDWSRRNGVELDTSCVSLDGIQIHGDESMQCSNFIVVHGAGSYGHFQASKSQVHKGGLDHPLVKAGFVATRISVTSLNLEIVRALAREGIPSVGMSPFSCGWSTSERNIASADISTMVGAINSGFIPVLHGDAVLDHSQGCTILSGDVIIRHLAGLLRPEYVVFLTDVFGVYDRPPSEPDAILLREIAVNEDGSWSVVEPTLRNTNNQELVYMYHVIREVVVMMMKWNLCMVSSTVEITVAAHDTTGGMATKLSEAAAIAKLGIDVYVVKAATHHAFKALNGEIKGKIPSNWLGTAIRFSGR